MTLDTSSVPPPPSPESQENPGDEGQTPRGDIDIQAGRDLTIGEFVGRDKIVNTIQNIQQTIQQRALTATETADHDRTIEVRYLVEGVSAFVERLQARAGEATDMLPGPGQASPYKGLLEYHLGDADVFFGRENAIQVLQKNLEAGPLTILHSESGAGKTSLLQAGISPRLIAAGHLPLYLRPYNAEPALAIKRAIISDPDRTPLLGDAPLRDFLRQVTHVLGVNTSLFILLDQFEEFFTQLAEPARAKFVSELAECLEDASLNVRWVLALRTEYFGHLANFRPRIRNPFENDYRLNRLTRLEAQDVITRPAESQGITFEPGLTDILLDDLGGNEIAPPQIQLVCLALFEELEPGEVVITRAVYEREGRAAGILRGHLERVLSRDLLPAQRTAARRLLESLISSETQRVLRAHRDLVAEMTAQGVTPETLDVILNQLVDSRLLRVRESETQGGELAYELAHDYLLSEIKLDPDVQARKAAQELLEQEVRAYQRYQTLLTEDRLKVIEPYRAELRLTPQAEQLLARSQAELQREKIAEEARRQKELEDARRLAEETEARRESETKRAAEAEQSAQRLRARNRLITGLGLLAVLAALVAGGLGLLSSQNATRAENNASLAQAANTQSAVNLKTAQAASTLAVAEATQSAAARAIAVAEGQRAEQAAREALAALSGQVAAQALNVVDSAPQLALLLAAEAVTITEGAGLPVLPDVETILRQTLMRSGGFGLGRVSQAEFLPDQRRLIALVPGEHILIFDLSQPDALVLSRMISISTSTEDFLLSGDAHWLILNQSGQIELWDIAGSTVPETPLKLDGVCPSENEFVLQTSPEGRWLACGHPNSPETPRLWDLWATDPAASALDLPRGALLALASNRVALNINSGVTVLDLPIEDPSQPISQTIPDGGHLDPQGRWLVTEPYLTFNRAGHATVVTPPLLWDLSQSEPISIELPIPIDVSFDSTGNDLSPSPNFSADGRWLMLWATNALLLWDLNASEIGEPLTLPGNELRLSADRRWLLDHDGSSVLLWELARLPDELQPRRLFLEDSGAQTGSSPRTDVRLGQRRSDRRPVPRAVNRAAVLGQLENFSVSPDGRWLAVFGGDDAGTLRLWDQALSPLPYLPRGHELPVSNGIFSRAGDWLITFAGESGSGVYEARLWNLKPFSLVADPFTIPGEDARFSPDQHWLVTKQATDLLVWDMTSLDKFSTPRRLPLPAEELWVWDFSPDGRWLLVQSDEAPLLVWDLNSPASDPVTLTESFNEISEFSVSPDGRWLVASFSPNVEAWLWDLSRPTSPPRNVVEFTESLYQMNFAPTGDWLIVATGRRLRLWNTIGLEDQAAPLVLTPESESSGDILSYFTFSPDGRWLLAFTNGGAARLLDLSAPDPTAQVYAYDELITNYAFSPGSAWLLTTFDDELPASYRLWDLSQPDPFAAPVTLTFPAVTGSVVSFAFTSDHWLVMAFPDTVVTWDLTALNVGAASAQIPNATPLLPDITFDRRWLITRSENADHLWDLTLTDFVTPTLTLPRTKDLSDNWRAIHLSPDGRWLFNLSAAQLAVWDLAAPDSRPFWLPERISQYYLKLDPVNPSVITVNQDRQAQSWTLALDALLDSVCLTAGRNLTLAEWEHYFPGQEYRMTCPGWPAGE